MKAVANVLKLASVVLLAFPGIEALRDGIATPQGLKEEFIAFSLVIGTITLLFIHVARRGFAKRWPGYFLSRSVALALLGIGSYVVYQVAIDTAVVEVQDVVSDRTDTLRYYAPLWPTGALKTRFAAAGGNRVVAVEEDRPGFERDLATQAAPRALTTAILLTLFVAISTLLMAALALPAWYLAEREPNG